MTWALLGWALIVLVAVSAVLDLVQLVAAARSREKSSIFCKFLLTGDNIPVRMQS